MEKYQRELYNVAIRHMDRRIRGKGSDGTMQYNADFTIMRKNPVFDGKVFVSTQLDLTPEQQSVVINSGVEINY